MFKYDNDDLLEDENEIEIECCECGKIIEVNSTGLCFECEDKINVQKVISKQDISNLRNLLDTPMDVFDFISKI